MGSKGSLPHSQQHATCPYPEPDQSSPFLRIPLLYDIPVYFLTVIPSYYIQNPLITTSVYATPRL